MRNRLPMILSAAALVVSTMALCLGGALASGVIITSKQIKNGTITSKDLKNNGVKSADLKNGTVSTPDLGNEAVKTADIGTNQVTPSVVQLPAPVQDTVAPSGPAPVTTGDFTKIATVGTYTKVQAESSLEVAWSGAVGEGPGTNCLFQLRVNGAAPSGGGGEVFTAGGSVNVSTMALFNGLAAGPVNIEVWAKASAAISNAPSCVMGPANPGIKSTFVVTEAVV